MVDRIVNSKISWIILGTCLLAMIIVMLYPKSDTDNVLVDGDKYEQEQVEDKIVFKLIGESDVKINLGDTYEELGVIALLNDNTDISSNVEIKNTIDYSKAGKYEIIYTLTYKNIKKELKRIVIVEGINENDVNIKLNGNEIIYLNINEEYDELNASATYKNEDISSEIEIENYIDITKSGEYEIKYKIEHQGIEKEVIRKVIVFDIDKLFSVDKENMVITITLNDNFSYVRLPSGVVNQNEVISYKVPGNGNYEFTIFTKDYKEYKKVVSIEASVEQPTAPITDTTAPSGTCEAILKDGKTTVTVKSNSNISKYNYNGVESNSSIYNVDKYLRESNVILTGKNGKTTRIDCKVTMEVLPVNKPSSGIKYTFESETMKVYIVSKSGFYISYVWMKDPVYQMKKYLVEGTKQKDVIDLLKDAVKKDATLKDKIVIGFNGAWYSSDRYKKNSIYKYEHTPLVLYNGVVVQNDYEKYQSSTNVYYINSSNQLKYIPNLTSKTVEERKQIFQEAIDDGAYNTLGFSPVLIENGVAITTYNKNASYEYNAYRQGICQIDSNNFILVTSGSGRTKNTVVFANMLKTLGCKTAFNVDGGGSTTLLYKPKGTTKITQLKGSTRDRPVVMYFTELD